MNPMEMFDPINPPHYRAKNGMEAIDVVEAFELDFTLGNAVKYILRAKKKGSFTENLRKAIWNIERAIKNATPLPESFKVRQNQVENVVAHACPDLDQEYPKREPCRCDGPCIGLSSFL